MRRMQKPKLYGPRIAPHSGHYRVPDSVPEEPHREISHMCNNVAPYLRRCGYHFLIRALRQLMQPNEAVEKVVFAFRALTSINELQVR